VSLVCLNALETKAVTGIIYAVQIAVG